MTNFLMIMTDQQRADYLGCYGHPLVKTPNIDSLAAKGRLFERFYVANPVCMPNRSAIFTGRYSSIAGIRHNGISLPLENNTFVDLLHQAGYDTALIGKAHLQNTLDGDPELGPNPRGEGPFANAKRVPEGNYKQELGSQWEQFGADAMELPYYGFSHVDLVTGHGDEAGAAHLLAQHEARPDIEALRGKENQLPHDYTCPQAIRTQIPEALHSTGWIKDRTLDYLSNGRHKDKPFFACVSFPDPHHPFTPPGKYWDMYKPEDMVLPTSFYERANNPPPHLKWLYEHGEIGKAGYGAALVNEDQAKQAIALTCGMITMVDDAIGEILQELEAQGLAEDTVVIFTADHGDFLGDHGMILKGPMHYQSTIRVPFIWSDPAVSGSSTTDELASSIDLSTSILARAGIQPYWGIQGRDLMNSSAPHAVLIEDEGNRVSLGFDKAPRLRTIVTQSHRMTMYLNEAWGELYDLRSDPDEINNLWDDEASEGVKQALMTDMVQLLMGACDASPWPQSLA